MLRTRLFFIFMLVFIGGSIAGVTTAQDALPLPLTPAHYLVLQADAQGKIQVMHHQMVTLAGTLTSLADSEIAARAAQPDRMSDAVTVRLLNSSGQVVYQTVQDVDGWLRGEFMIDPANPGVMRNGTNIDGHFIPLTTRTFVVRVPDAGRATTLQITLESGSRTVSSLNLDAVSQQFVGKEIAPRSSSIPGWDHGDPANRVDILVMGDGYRAVEESLFDSDALNLANGWGSITPYEDYASFVNMRSLFTASNQSGADQPACPTDPPDGGLDNNTFVDTAFDATFCTNGTWRLLYINDAKVATAAAAEPNWDHIFIVVNTPIYGGAGGWLAVASTNTYAIDVLRHEYGHSFTKLADEYDYAGGNGPSCFDDDAISSNDCEVNVTNVKTLAKLKWDYWVEPGTSIPTTGPLDDPEGAGLWEGAKYTTTGMYRQCYDCLMRSLGTPFGHVASEAYVMRLYDGGWGVPANGVRIIEPGTASPSASSVDIPLNGTKNFAAQILVSSSGATVEWSIDGVTVSSASYASGDTPTYLFNGDTAGVYTLKMKVIDQSTLLHPDNSGMQSKSLTWQVSVGSARKLLVNGSMETDTNNDKIPDSWKGKLLTKDRIKCDKDTQIVAYTGECAFRFKGSIGEDSSLVQIIPLNGLNFASGDSLTLSSYVMTTSDAVTGSLLLRVKYSDSTATGKLTLDYPISETYTPLGSSLLLESGAVRKVKVVLTNTSPGGKAYVDAVNLVYIPGGLTAGAETGAVELAPNLAGRGHN